MLSITWASRGVVALEDFRTAPVGHDSSSVAGTLVPDKRYACHQSRDPAGVTLQLREDLRRAIVYEEKVHHAPTHTTYCSCGSSIPHRSSSSGSHPRPPLPLSNDAHSMRPPLRLTPPHPPPKISRLSNRVDPAKGLVHGANRDERDVLPRDDGEGGVGGGRD